MGKRRADQGSRSDQGMLTPRTLGLPTDIFEAVLAKAVQQHGTASSLRLTSCSIAHRCGALVTGTIYLESPNLHSLSRGEFQRWLWQVRVLQRAFPNSILKPDDAVNTADDADIHHLLSCTELRGVAVSPTSTPDERNRQFWHAIAALGRLHGSRLQLHVPKPGAFWMLVAEPSLAAHISQAALPWSADAGRALADLVSLSSLTKLTLPILASVLGEAGMLDALRQLSGLQSLYCVGDDMQMLLVNAVPRSWTLLTKLQLTLSASGDMNEHDPLDWSLVKQQCPQLQALTVPTAVPPPLCLTALTSLTCQYWLPEDTNSFQCSKLGHLHVWRGVDLNLLPSKLTSLTPGPYGSSICGHGKPPRSAPAKRAVSGAHLFHDPLGGSFRHPGRCASHSHCSSHFCDVC